jgi:hypothetical protein
MASLILQVLLQAAFLLSDGSPPPPADALIAHAESLLRRLQVRTVGVRGPVPTAPSLPAKEQDVAAATPASPGDGSP